MVDIAAGRADATHFSATDTSRVSGSQKQTPWFSYSVGILLTVSLFSLKVVALGHEQNWGFVRDIADWRQASFAFDAVAWHAGQWTNIAVYTLEAIIAGAAGSIVFNYAINNISQTISNIWQQVDLTGSPDPTITRVEPETRSWLSSLSHESAKRAAETMRAQEARISELQAEIDTLREQNARLGSDIEVGNARIGDAFGALIEQIRRLKEELSRRPGP